MIKKLEKISEIEKAQIGNKAYDLWKIYRNGLQIENTIILSQEEFLNFRSILELTSVQIESIQKLISDQFPKNIDGFQVICSENCLSPGLVSHIQTSRSISQVKHAIERIQKSYWKDEAVAWRLVRKKPDLQYLPAIIIQPYFKETFRITTRSPQTGIRTNSTNYSDDENNNIDSWIENYSFFIKKIEKITTRACNVSFRINDDIVTCLVEDSKIPMPAYFRYLTDILDDNVIDSLEYLMRIQPCNLNSIIDIDESIKSVRSRSIKVDGVSFNDGFGMGKLVIPGSLSNLKKTFEYCYAHEKKYIIAQEMFDPDWEPLIKYSDGAIGSRGGQTCHLAIIARNLDKPAIRLPIYFDYSKSRIVLDSGVEVKQFSDTIIFSSKGIVLFNCDSNSSIFYIRDSFQVYLRLISDLIFKYLDQRSSIQIDANNRSHIQYLWLKLAVINKEFGLNIPEFHL